MKYTIIQVDGSEITHTTKGEASPEVIQGWVEGYFEATKIAFGRRIRMAYINEEGALSFSSHPRFPRQAPLPANQKASLLAGIALRGPVVIRG